MALSTSIKERISSLVSSVQHGDTCERGERGGGQRKEIITLITIT